MAADKGDDTSFITLVFLSLIFFGLTVKTTLFFYPEYGQEIYDYINFYARAILLAVAGIALKFFYKIYKHRQIPELPNISLPWWKVTIRFIIFFVVAFYVFGIIFNHGFIPSFPDGKTISEQIIVSNLENLFTYILLPALILKNIHVGGYKNILGLKVPNLDRLIAYSPVILFTTGLHAGNYSLATGNPAILGAALFVNFALFMFMFMVFESIGYGASEGIHAGWNTALMVVTGSII